MDDSSDAGFTQPPLPDHLEQICDRFEAAWKAVRAGEQRPRLEDFLTGVADLERSQLLRTLVLLEFDYRFQLGDTLLPEEYHQRFPELPMDWLAKEWKRCQKLALAPECIGRYRVKGELGKGSFGRVIIARDEILDRDVAIKVPHRRLVAKPEDAEPYLTEARTVANLDHPSIVPIYDVGSTEDWPFYEVSKYIDGSNLETRLKQSRLSLHEAVKLVATVAEALNYAHKQGIVHRDIKPGNILLDKEGKTWVADFGLALREQDVGRGPPCYVGTPAYMSPEQARCEGNRVDGRSDIFSLGIVFYELLTGRRPFKSDKQNKREMLDELREQITSLEPRPPRQIDNQIPKELDRICLKALSKRASERYSAAMDVAEDLRQFLAGAPVPEKSSTEKVKQDASTATPAPTPTPSHRQDSVEVKILFNGLRSYEAQDAYFFLELLPGQRDRDGLPESLRFWKIKIQEPDPDKTFSVGLIYGPSGCGKSSLVKAGLLPRLSENVIAVYVEATPEETETRLLNGLRRQLPDLAHNLNLVDSLSALRRGRYFKSGQKVLLVLDQFEQWLHAWHGEENAELALALRHCEGGRLQCLVLVRDDFWMALTRFMAVLDVKLIPGKNIAPIDLFSPRHAKKVLAGFGRAFEALDERPDKLTKDQDAFLDRAVAWLAEGDKVIPVRLALFWEMVKNKTWNRATLDEWRDMDELGVSFLEESFFASTAPTQNQRHQDAAQAVLNALLPEEGAAIKGHMQSHAELLKASGYSNRPKKFEELIGILDSELRLITLTDPEGKDEATESSNAIEKYYQLTHDFLVHTLRGWLTRKQKETRHGRAELLLADRGAVWNARTANRQLPSQLEWMQIRLFTRSRSWTAPERKMMRKCDGYYLVRYLGLLAASCLIIWAAVEYTARMHADELRTRLLSAEMAEVPPVLKEIEPRRSRVDPLLHEALSSETDPRRKLRLSLGLVHSDRTQVPALYDRLLDASPEEFAVIRQVLEPFKDDLNELLWSVLENKQQDSDRRFRAACALVQYARRDPRWDNAATFVVNLLGAQSPLALDHWKAVLGPVHVQLLPALAMSLESRPPADHLAIIEFYRHFASDDPEACEPLQERLKTEQTGLSGVERAKRRAAIAAALVALGKGENVWPLLIHTSNPTLRSFLIERLGTAGINPKMLVEQLGREKDISARRALVLALGNFPPKQLPELSPFLLERYENDPDPGIHGACRCTLRHWNQKDNIATIDEKLAKGQVEGDRRWYVNKRQSDDRFTMTFAVIEGLFSLGPGTEKNVQPSTHRFAIAATEVTVEQFRSLMPEHPVNQKAIAPFDSPVNKVSWYDAAEFCNRLSQREELPPCYRKGEDGKLDLYPDYLKRSGYRLPTEWEWQFACRAGAQTAWHFGEADRELACYYAWFDKNAENDDGVLHPHPVSQLKPNDFGLFDLHGNLSEWCQNSGPIGTNIINAGIAMGGDYNHSYGEMACDKPFPVSQWTFSPTRGFRVARTMPAN